MGTMSEKELMALKKSLGTKETSQNTMQPEATDAYQKPDLSKIISADDFERVAEKTFTPKAWAFYSSAATDLVTRGMNVDFYKRIMLRPRVMRNVKGDCNLRSSILGCSTSGPFFVSPCAMARLAHPDGELAIARGCAAEDIIQIVSIFPQSLPTPD